MKQISLNNSLKYISLGLALVFSHKSIAYSQDDFNQIINKYKLSKDHVGIVIENQNKLVFENNPKKQFIPASISKLVTSFSILKNFELNQKFKTELYSDGFNLYIKGGGDPSFVSENMWFLVNEFTRQNSKIIKGDIIVDDSYFDKVRFDDSRESKRVDRSYDAPVGAMSFNWNSINIFVKPTVDGEKAQVVLDPTSQYFELINKTTTRSKVHKELIIDVNQSKRIITVSGDVSKNADEKAYYKNVAEPDLWTGENLKAFLEQRGIKVLGKVKSGVVSSKATKVATYEGKSLSAVLADMNKFSNNFVAEMLTKNLAAQSGTIPATLSAGIQKINQDLRSVGLGVDQILFENPSGFTRENKISAYAIVAVLKEMQNDFRLFPTILDSLPISGVDGTLKKRMKDEQVQGFVRGKTGYLDGVVSLAGYAGLKNGDILRFAFLYNGPQDEGKVRECFDQILTLLLK